MQSYGSYATMHVYTFKRELKTHFLTRYWWQND